MESTLIELYDQIISKMRALQSVLEKKLQMNIFEHEEFKFKALLYQIKKKQQNDYIQHGFQPTEALPDAPEKPFWKELEKHADHH